MEYVDRTTGEITDRPPQEGHDPARIVWQSDGRTLRIETAQRVEADYDEHPRETARRAIEDEEWCTEESHSTRSKISGFSAASRRRLRRLLYGLRRDTKMLFVTLTYHETWPTPSEVKAHIDRFAKRIRRRRPDCSLIWRMEPHESGRPHIHCFITRCGFWHVKDASKCWHEVTEETSADHEKTAVEIIRIRPSDGEKLAAYVAKYISKADDIEHWPVDAIPEDESMARLAWQAPGRMWGVTNRDALPLAPFDEWAYIPADHAERLIQFFLAEWDVDIPDGVIPPSLTICHDAPYSEAMDLVSLAEALTTLDELAGADRPEVYDPRCDLPF